MICTDSRHMDTASLFALQPITTDNCIFYLNPISSFNPRPLPSTYINTFPVILIFCISLFCPFSSFFSAKMMLYLSLIKKKSVYLFQPYGLSPFMASLSSETQKTSYIYCLVFFSGSPISHSNQS